ncbi:cadherin-like domain-containing protein [Steroidobacter sp. S1-65]|uniref:Cadherin-like domain-containing protein n=1 Tax=Steroidobacter gossypii TaxID=2805490 RepID=A0ABS1X3L3_9GAMM|nr:Ig-like domain-containing protein [Steroidobacter gossypii]MBM0107800.1 cadherin-like domain-containing protein [Steroidobacter gossypii]
MRNASSWMSLGRALIGMVVLAVAGCGGGGGGGRTNAPPALGSLAFSTKLNTDLQGQVPATDPSGEALTFSVTAHPSSGTLVNFSPTGAFVYRPGQGFLGDDSFRVQVSDAGGNTVPGVVNINVHPNRVPAAANDAMRADGAALANIVVLANDTDADSDPLTVTIEEAPLTGTATVNANSSIGISALPADFKGVTRFKYRVTDSSGASAIATAAVFVGVDPFRVVFAGDPAANGSPEVCLSDFAAEPTALTVATEGSMRLRGFAASQNGATVVYRREDQSNAAGVDLGFVRTASPIQRGTVPLPVGATLPLDAGNKDQFLVSPNGQWLALIARVGSADGVYVFNVASPGALTKVSPANAVFASRLRFSRDSRNLYFLASPVAGGGSKTLYTMTPSGPSPTVPVSAISDPATSDDVLDYSIAANQTSILIHANRSGRQGLFFIDARQLQAETQVSHTLGFGEIISASTISLTGGTIGGGVGQRVGYTVRTPLLTSRAYVAEVSATPNPREVDPAGEVIGLRPDDGALLYAKSGQIYERDLTTGGDTMVAAGGAAWYDSTGNIVLVQQAQFSGLTPYPVLAVTTRGAFGGTHPLGTPAQAARLSEVSGFDRGVALLAEGSPAAAAPARARVALVNALAPDRLLYLSEFESPLQLTSPAAVVVAR